MSQYRALAMSQPGESSVSVRTDDSPDSESRQQSGGPSSRKRASRAGTRSVNTLSAAQLERKRANDREAQRAIRQRTKEHIDTLERRISDINSAAEPRERLLAATQHRNAELEEENAYLRNRLGNDPFVLQISGTEASRTDSAVAPPPQASPQTRLSGAEIPRPPSGSTRRSISTTTSHSSAQAESWRQSHAGFTPSDPSAGPGPRSETARAPPFRHPSDVTGGVPSANVNSSIDHAQRSFSASSASHRPQWTGNQGYGYMGDPGAHPSTYAGQDRPVKYEYPQQQQQTQQYAMQTGHPGPPSQHPSYPPVPTPAAEFQNMSIHSPGAGAPQGGPQAVHEQHPGQAPYHVSPTHMTPGAQFHSQAHQPGMHREHLAPTYAPPATSQSSHPYAPPNLPQGQQMPMEYQGASGQHAYPYGQYHGNG